MAGAAPNGLYRGLTKYRREGIGGGLLTAHYEGGTPWATVLW